MQNLARGLEALRAGRDAEAAEILKAASAAAPHDPTCWFGLAMACERLGDIDGADQALDRVLGLDPKNVVALVLRADHHVLLQRPREANAYYRAAIFAAEGQPGLPRAAAEAVARARQFADAQSEAFRRHLLQGLAQYGYRQDSAPARLNRTIESLIGATSLEGEGTGPFPQAPTVFKYAGLPHYEFADTAAFDWVKTLESQTDTIESELNSASRNREHFNPYLTWDPNVPRADYGDLQDSSEWTALYLVKNGVTNLQICDRFPKTMELLQRLPLHRLDGKAPSLLFSRLTPGARIPPHHGMMNTRLICHLPIIVPGQGALRVGSQTREWRRGECFIFDDSIQHEAWNLSERERIVLLFEVWRPELSEDERTWIGRIFDITAKANAGLGMGLPGEPS